MNKFISVLLAVLLFTTNALGAVTISWPSAVVDANHDAAVNYDVRRKSGTGNYVSIAVITGTSYTDSLAGDPGGITYTYQVFSQNPGGSAPSNEVSITTPAAPPSSNVFVPPAVQLIDIKNRVWTLGPSAPGGNRYLLVDGQFAGGASGTVIASCSSVVHHKNSAGEWYRITPTDGWTYIGKVAPCV